MNIRDAILKAADHIERFPEEFSFNSYTVPERPHCGTPGCALGWMIAFAGTGHSLFMAFAQQVLGIVPHGKMSAGYEFYCRMDELVGADWVASAEACAAGLRLYADKYHPAPEPHSFARELMAKLPSEPLPQDVAVS